MNISFKKLNDNAKIPTKAHFSAGYDLFPLEEGSIYPGQQSVIKLGFATEFGGNIVAIIDDRGSVGASGVGHMAGVIDSDYRGEWMVILRNFGQNLFEYSPKKAIAQVLFLQVEPTKWVEVKELGVTIRGSRKLGSSDNVN